jgi:AcrR family transcriptional regulator
MSPEQRRETVVRAALPLVAEFGAAVTTQQVARAAGIGEATIFRVFPDKDAMLDACVAEALDPTNVLRELRSISLDQLLAARLVEAADALRAHLGRMGTVIGALHASGHGRRPAPNETPDNRLSDRSAGRDAAQAETRSAIAELFEPDQATLRLPIDTLTDAFVGLVFGHGRMPGGGQPRLNTEQVVDLFLHGAVTAHPDSGDHQ